MPEAGAAACRPGARLNCRAPCALCGACGAVPPEAEADFQARSHAALAQGTWRHVEVRPGPGDLRCLTHSMSCAGGIFWPATSGNQTDTPASCVDLAKGEEGSTPWVEEGGVLWRPSVAPARAQGRFRSVMVVVSPCRSDMSAHGLAPWAHLADGRLTLVLVRECSMLQYLRFLTSIPRHGAPRLRGCAALGPHGCRGPVRHFSSFTPAKALDCWAGH